MENIKITVPLVGQDIAVEGENVTEKTLEFLQSLREVTTWEENEKWFRDRIKEGKIFWDPCG